MTRSVSSPAITWEPVHALKKISSHPMALNTGSFGMRALLFVSCAARVDWQTRLSSSPRRRWSGFYGYVSSNAAFDWGLAFKKPSSGHDRVK
jgi:hypothetical protein